MDEEKTRFSMIKERHKKSLEEAIKNKKIDEKMISITNYLKKTKDYYTTSSCTGRISLMQSTALDEKRENVWIRKWHRTIKLKEVLEGLNETKKELIWFKLEPLVMVIGTNTQENAIKLMKIIRMSGIKRLGINVIKKGKYLIELFGTQYISLPIKKQEKLLVSEDYLKELIKIANKKIEKNFQTLKNLEKILREKL